MAFALQLQEAFHSLREEGGREERRSPRIIAPSPAELLSSGLPRFGLPGARGQPAPSPLLQTGHREPGKLPFWLLVGPRGQ